MSTVGERPHKVTKTYVHKRLRDWERRIMALFKQIGEWAAKEWGEGSVVWGERLQRNEHMMQQFGVPPRRLPTVEVRTGKRTVTFLPSCLWIIGANGRVDVIAGPSSYMIVDMAGEDGRPSEWQISNPDSRIVLEPFTRDVFRRITGA